MTCFNCVVCHVHSIRFCHCDCVDLTLWFLEHYGWLMYCAWYQHAQPTHNMSLLIGGTKFLWHVATTDCVVFELSDRTTINSQRPGNLLRPSQVGSGSLEWDHLKIYMTVIIDTDINLHQRDHRWWYSDCYFTLVYWYSWKRVAK